MKEKRGVLNKLETLIYLLQRARIAQVFTLLFMLFIVWDFHVFYKENFREFTGWQMSSVIAYGTFFVAAIRHMFEHLDKVIRRDRGGE